jgi:chorismate synthase
VLSHVVSIGARAVPAHAAARPDDLAAIDASPVRVFDAAASDRLVAEVDAAKREGDTLGGVVEVLAYGLPPGLGSYVHWDRRLDSRLAGALMGIQAIKGVEVGDGFEAARRPGSLVMDEIVAGSEGLTPHERPAGRHRGRHVDRRGRFACAPR